MLVILPMHHRSPSAAGTVPTSIGGELAEFAEPALLGAAIAHAPGGHDAQLHVHGAPEAVSKVTASTAPAAAVGCVHCAAYSMGTDECAPPTVGVAVVGDRVGDGDVGDSVGDSVGAVARRQPVQPTHTHTHTHTRTRTRTRTRTHTHWQHTHDRSIADHAWAQATHTPELLRRGCCCMLWFTRARVDVCCATPLYEIEISTSIDTCICWY
jgi:hypothetical protein